MGSFGQNPCSLQRNGIPFYQEVTVQRIRQVAKNQGGPKKMDGPRIISGIRKSGPEASKSVNFTKLKTLL